MTIKVGQPLPNVTFMQMGEAGPQPVSSADAFKGKRTALFAVPGAYTPTCSAARLSMCQAIKKTKRPCAPKVSTVLPAHRSMMFSLWMHGLSSKAWIPAWTF